MMETDPEVARADDLRVATPMPTSTRAAVAGASIVALVIPILAFITNQSRDVQQMALMIALVAIPSAALIVAVEMLTGAYLTIGMARLRHDSEARPTAAKQAATARRGVRQ